MDTLPPEIVARNDYAAPIIDAIPTVCANTLCKSPLISWSMLPSHTGPALVLGCDVCSDTLATLDDDTVIDAMLRGYRPQHLRATVDFNVVGDMPMSSWTSLTATGLVVLAGGSSGTFRYRYTADTLRLSTTDRNMLAVAAVNRVGTVLRRDGASFRIVEHGVGIVDADA